MEIDLRGNRKENKERRVYAKAMDITGEDGMSDDSYRKRPVG
jgi:hypothetical protein